MAVGMAKTYTESSHLAIHISSLSCCDKPMKCRIHPNNPGFIRTFSDYFGNSGKLNSEILTSNFNQISLVLFSVSHPHPQVISFPPLQSFFSFPQHWIMNMKSWITSYAKIICLFLAFNSFSNLIFRSSILIHGTTFHKGRTGLLETVNMSQ